MTNTTNHFDDCYNRDADGWHDEKIDAYRVARGSISNLVLEGNRAVRESILPLEQEGRAANITVSDERIFYTTTT